MQSTNAINHATQYYGMHNEIVQTMVFKAVMYAFILRGLLIAIF